METAVFPWQPDGEWQGHRDADKTALRYHDKKDNPRPIRGKESMPKTAHKVVVIGHRNPDTDSICSAIAYAELKNKTSSLVCEARRAG